MNSDCTVSFIERSCRIFVLVLIDRGVSNCVWCECESSYYNLVSATDSESASDVDSATIARVVIFVDFV
jgi:hypothetical protein